MKYVILTRKLSFFQKQKFSETYTNAINIIPMFLQLC